MVNSMSACKSCSSNNIVKSGIVGGRQRFRCKKCNHNFRLGDNRTDETVAAKKFLCILLYFTTNNSFRANGKIVQADPSLIHRWIREFVKNMPELQLYKKYNGPMEIKEILLFMNLKKENFMPVKQLIIARKELLPEHLTAATLQYLKNGHASN